MSSGARIVSCMAMGALLMWSTGAASAKVTFDWVVVDQDLGNAPDHTGFGSVGYAYQISKYEVTNAQYAEFLNAVDPTGANAEGLYSSNMSSGARGGINFDTAATNGSKYEVKTGRGRNPVVFVNFYDTLRFANWLHNGQGVGDTESGAYTLLGGTEEPTNASFITRNSGAEFFLTSENEWYKAAYYDPTTGSYFDYATRSNIKPTSEPPVGGSNSANYRDNTTGYALTGSTELEISVNYLTDVGAYANSVSPFGTFDQTGNVFEWNESLIRDKFRGFRGGSWQVGATSYLFASNNSVTSVPSSERNHLGFRVARLVPEPTTMFFLAFGSVAVLGGRPRRRD